MIYTNGISFNEFVMEEIGLEVSDYDKHIADQDTSLPITCNGKFLTTKTREEGIRSNEVLFDPIHNAKQMQLLFGYYTNKLAAENDGALYVDTLYAKKENEKGFSSLAIKVNRQEIASKPYCNESVKYADLICQLNGEKNVDLSVYDTQYT